MNVTLYINKSEYNRLDKSLESPVSLDGNFRGEADVLNPTITVNSSANLSGYNYFYIPMLSRYYFITSMSINPNGIWIITGKVDVLTSYKNTIRQQKAVIARNESQWNLYLPDNCFKTSVRRRVQTKEFPTHFNQIPSYIIAFGGGN